MDVGEHEAVAPGPGEIGERPLQVGLPFLGRLLPHGAVHRSRRPLSLLCAVVALLATKTNGSYPLHIDIGPLINHLDRARLSLEKRVSFRC